MAATETRTETKRLVGWRPVVAVSGVRLGGVAEDTRFELVRAVNPTRFPSERHRPLGESSARKITRSGGGGRTGRLSK